MQDGPHLCDSFSITSKELTLCFCSHRALVKELPVTTWVSGLGENKLPTQSYQQRLALWGGPGSLFLKGAGSPEKGHHRGYDRTTLRRDTGQHRVPCGCWLYSSGSEAGSLTGVQCPRDPSFCPPGLGRRHAPLHLGFVCGIRTQVLVSVRHASHPLSHIPSAS